MKAQIHWLVAQLDDWVAHGVISHEQARAIRARYPEPPAATPWGMIIFTGIGAVTIGLGVILLFAYNWAEMTKAAKLAIVFSALALAHGAGIVLYRGAGWRRAMGDTLCLLGTMLFGAGIWLVAQIYHIDEHYPNAFLVWSLGALALAWVMPSVMQGMLAAVLLTIWVCAEAAGFDHAVTWAPLLLAGALGTLAWRLRSRVLLFFTAAALLVVAATVTGTLHSNVTLILLTVAAGYLAVSEIVRARGWFAESAPVWGFAGWSVFLFICYLMSFKAAVNDVLRLRYTHVTASDALYTWLPFVAVLALWCAAAWARATSTRRRETDEHSFEIVLVPVALIACQYVAFSGARQYAMLAAGVFNLVLLALAMAWMVRGCRHALLRHTILGSMILAAVTAGRYFDLFESLAVRGFTFILIGAVLIAEGILFMRSRRRLRITGGAV